MLKVKDTFEKSSFVGETCLVDFKGLLKSFHEMREIRVLSVPQSTTAEGREADLKRIFLKVLDKRQKRGSGVFLSAFSMIKGLLDNRFEVGSQEETE